MLDLTGEVVLALWNGVEPSRAREYDAWHTREHVPERVAVPGMLGARRYVKVAGPLPAYLTLYSLETIEVLRSEPYRVLLDKPSSWSRAMRPSLRDFLRIPCKRLMSGGGGLGGITAACLLDENELSAISAKSGLQSLLEKQRIIAVHVLVRDPSVPDVPFQLGSAKPNFASAGALLIEGYDSTELDNWRRDVSGILRDASLNAGENTLTTYRLAYAIDRASLKRVIPIEWKK